MSAFTIFQPNFWTHWPKLDSFNSLEIKLNVLEELLSRLPYILFVMLSLMFVVCFGLGDFDFERTVSA